VSPSPVPKDKLLLRHGDTGGENRTDEVSSLGEVSRQLMEHLSPEIAGNFVTGRLPREENRRVVRHLLGQCPACLKLLHSLDPLFPIQSVGMESPQRQGEIPAALFSAVDRFIQGLEAAGAEADSDV
jgi:hypothetical protein